MAQKLDGEEVYWISPPVALISDALDHLLSFEKVQAVIFVPIWAGNSFWFKLREGKYFKPFVQDYIIFSPEFIVYNSAKSCLFNGFKKFYSMAIKIETSSNFTVEYPVNLFLVDEVDE